MWAWQDLRWSLWRLEQALLRQRSHRQLFNSMSSDKFNFKSSGKKVSQVRTEKIAQPEELPLVGIKLPIQYGTENFFAMNRTSRDQIKDNLKNLLMTNHGDRLGLFGYGANLREILVEGYPEEQFEAEVNIRIQTSIATWMSYVTAVGYDFSGVRKKGNRYFKVLVLQYKSDALGIPEDYLEVEFEVIR